VQVKSWINNWKGSETDRYEVQVLGATGNHDLPLVPHFSSHLAPRTWGPYFI